MSPTGIQRHRQVGGATLSNLEPPLIPPDSPIWDMMQKRDPNRPIPNIADIFPPQPGKVHNQYCKDDWDMYHGDGPRGMGAKGDGCVCELASPRLWDKAPEDGVVHIAGAWLTLFGRYMRQRCEWCGIVLVEYDLHRVAVPTGQPGEPPHWEPGSLVRVDGNMSAAIDNPRTGDGEVQLPPDSCGYDPKTQVGT